MTLKINGRTRLTKAELLDYKQNSGITDLQYRLLKRRYYDGDTPTVVAVCLELNISPKKFNIELRKAIAQIIDYTKE